MVLIHRWSLYAGSITYGEYTPAWGPVKCGLRNRWSFYTGGLQAGLTVHVKLDADIFLLFPVDLYLPEDRVCDSASHSPQLQHHAAGSERQQTDSLQSPRGDHGPLRQNAEGNQRFWKVSPPFV